MIRLEVVNDITRNDLAAAWDELTRAGGCPSVFSCRPWVTAWASAFGEKLGTSIAVASGDGGTIGILPLFRRADGAFTTPVNFLSHRGEVVAVPGREAETVDAALSETRERGATVVLRGLPLGSTTRRAVEEAASDAGYVVSSREGRSSPVVDITSDWATYYDGRPRKVSHEWERKIRKLDRAGEVVVRSGADGDTDAMVAAFADLEEESWKRDAGTSIRGRGVEGFYRDVSRALSDAGWLRPWWVELDGRMVAFLYAVELDGTCYALKTSYRKDAAKLSPGVRLFRDAIRDAFERGLRRFDFVGQPARWKDEWATGRLEHEDVTLHPDDPAGRGRAFLEGRLKPAARRVRDAVRGSNGDGGR